MARTRLLPAIGLGALVIFTAAGVPPTPEFLHHLADFFGDGPLR
jgi:hypothetical protein